MRGHPFRLSIPIIKNNTHRNFFSVRTIKIWNALPTEIVTAKNINIFKIRLNQHDLSKFLIGPSYSLSPQLNNHALNQRHKKPELILTNCMYVT